jgi:hypothetical protein
VDRFNDRMEDLKYRIGRLSLPGHYFEHRVALLRRGPTWQNGLHLPATLMQGTWEEEGCHDGDAVEFHVTVMTFIYVHGHNAIAVTARRRRIRFTRTTPITAAILKPLALPEPRRLRHGASPRCHPVSVGIR